MYSNQALFSYQIFMYYTWIFMLKLIKTAKVLFQVHFKCNWFCIAVGWSKPQKELKAFSFYRFQDSIMHEIAWVWPWQVFKKECSMMINLPFISRCSFKRWKTAVLPKSSWKIGWKEKKKLYNFWKGKFNRQLGDFHIWKRKGFCAVVLLIDVILILINGTFYGGPWGLQYLGFCILYDCCNLLWPKRAFWKSVGFDSNSLQTIECILCIQSSGYIRKWKVNIGQNT